MISTLPRSSRQFSRQGFSLIEVAIALVIFVIGALAIIRIFPGALNVINNNGDQQIAANLNRDLTTTLKSNVTLAATQNTRKVDFNAVPDAVFNNSNPDGSLSYNTWNPLNVFTGPTADHSRDWMDGTTSVIGVPRFNGSLPTTDELETRAGNSALSRHRAIVGERARLTFLDEGQLGPDPVYYAYTQFPISVQLQGTTPAVLRPIQPAINQDYDLENVRINQNGVLDFSQTNVDENNDVIDANTPALPVNRGSVLYVTYRYISVGSPDKYWGVSEEAIPVLTTLTNLRVANIPPIRVQPPLSGREAVRVQPLTSIPISVVPEIVKVRLRQFAGLGEFGKNNLATAIEQVADARRGMMRLPNNIAQNPPGSNYGNGIVSGTVYQKVIDTKPLVIDYMADWSILLQVGTLRDNPSGAFDQTLLSGPTPKKFQQISLGAPYIEDQSPVAVYSLLLEGTRAHRSGYGTVSPNPNASAVSDRLVLPVDDQDREDELRAGRATFIVENNTPDARLGGAIARVAYQTRDQWVKQLAVAARSYKPFEPLTTVGGVNARIEPWRDYVLGDDNYLYFHASEAGKTISLSYTILVTNGGVTEQKTVVDKPFVIDSQLINRPGTVPVSFSSGLVSRVRLTDFSGGPLAFDDLVSIQAVRGTSVTSRTAYVNGRKYAQSLLTSYRENK